VNLPTDHRELSAAELQQIRETVLGQMEFCRQYSLSLVADIEPELWYVAPSGAPSTIGWQVGHLAFSQYGLMLFRQRGREASDLDLIPGWFRKQYGRGTSGNPEQLSNPLPASELLTILGRVHETAVQTVRSLPIEQFGEATDMPYAVYPRKIGALMFCPIHESLHAGQIGIIRRMLGKDPLR
jgi:hypothetical protein